MINLSQETIKNRIKNFKHNSKLLVLTVILSVGFWYVNSYSNQISNAIASFMIFSLLFLTNGIRIEKKEPKEVKNEP